jgi:antitoxin component YwqK of YwqJK toxin-antitoxin module
MEKNNSKESPDNYYEIRKSYWRNGQLRSVDSHLNGWLHGPVMEYYQDGTVQTTGAYKKGNLDGPWSFFFRGNGENEIEFKGIFKNNEEIGLWYEAQYED